MNNINLLGEYNELVFLFEIKKGYRPLGLQPLSGRDKLSVYCRSALFLLQIKRWTFFIARFGFIHVFRSQLFRKFIGIIACAVK